MQSKVWTGADYSALVITSHGPRHVKGNTACVTIPCCGRSKMLLEFPSILVTLPIQKPESFRWHRSLLGRRNLLAAAFEFRTL